MKKKITELLKKRRVAAGLTAIVLAVAVGSVAVVQQKSQIPELPVYTDPEMETNIEEEETPLADKPVVKTTTSKKTTTKKVKMKKAAAKTYTKELPATSTTSKKTAQTSSASVVTKTTVVKKIEEKYTKKSKVKVVTTVATTTVTTTTTAKAGVSTGVNSAGTVNNSGVTGTVEVGQLAPKEDSRVLTAYRTLGFKVNVDPSVSYSGYFNARNRQITLKKAKKKGYTFEGWYKESSFKNRITTIPKGSKGNLTIYAKWKANKYTVRFHGNKATSGSMQEMKNLEYDMDYTLRKNKFKRKGYKFVRWNTKADGSGKKYGNKEEIENLSAKNGAVVDLYAQWSRDTYKITYKTNGGELADGTAKKYNVDTRTFKLKTPVRYGYTFKGWYKDKKCTRRVTQVKKGTIGNLTFYAKWQINKYKIKYDGNGATSGSMKGVSVCQYGKTYTLTKNKFKRTGYVFEGWNTKKNGKGDFYEDGEDIRNITAKNGKTVTLYAQWSKKQYTIKYVLDGGTISSENPTGYYYDTPTIQLAAAAKEGYTFKGWYTDSAFKNKITKIKKGTRKNYKLYAKWKINTYNIVFDGNGATSGSMKSISSCKYNTSYKLSANTFQRNGYKFIGWSTKADGSDTFYGDGATVSNLSLTNGATVKLYAQWEAL